MTCITVSLWIFLFFFFSFFLFFGILYLSCSCSLTVSSHKSWYQSFGTFMDKENEVVNKMLTLESRVRNIISKYVAEKKIIKVLVPIWNFCTYDCTPNNSFWILQSKIRCSNHICFLRTLHLLPSFNKHYLFVTQNGLKTHAAYWFWQK